MSAHKRPAAPVLSPHTSFNSNNLHTILARRIDAKIDTVLKITFIKPAIL